MNDSIAQTLVIVRVCVYMYSRKDSSRKNQFSVSSPLPQPGILSVTLYSSRFVPMHP